MDIEHLDFKNNSFNGIWAVTSLLHIPKKKLGAIIKKLSKILKREGVLYVCVEEGDREIFEKERNGSERFFAYWKEDELKKLFREHFTLIDSERVKFKEDIFLQMFFRKK
jgi:SAM-dependent methyltransferase